MTDKPRYKIISTPALVTVRFRDGTELKMSPQYAGKLAIDIDLAAINAEKKGRKKMGQQKKCDVAVKYDYVPPRQLTPRSRIPGIDEINDQLAAARAAEIRKGWDRRMQEAEAIAEERLGSRNALHAAIVAGYDPASGKDETVITERTRENAIRVIHDSVDGEVPMRKRIQDISGLAAKRDLTTVEIDLKKAETDAMEKAVFDACPLTS